MADVFRQIHRRHTALTELAKHRITPGERVVQAADRIGRAGIVRRRREPVAQRTARCAQGNSLELLRERESTATAEVCILGECRTTARTECSQLTTSDG